MTDRNRLKDRARDELFSHINRCGVLQAEHEAQEQWLKETMEYLGERYPDLADADIKELYTVGLRFCRPAIAHGRRASALTVSGKDGEGEAVTAGAEDASAS
jgi:hypothetical protein